MIHAGYVLLSHGARHTSALLADRPGAATQVKRIVQLITSLDRRVPAWRHDHVRTPKGPGSFPNLFTLLGCVKEREATGVIVVDDTCRLLRNISLDDQEKMLAALEPYQRNILDVRRRRLLSSLRPVEWIALCLESARKNSSPLADSQWCIGPELTRRARHVSRIARAQMADRFAQLVVVLRNELATTGPAPTNVELARIANERGLLTSRGNPWSDVTVGRALKRVTESDKAE